MNKKQAVSLLTQPVFMLRMKNYFAALIAAEVP